MHFFLLLRAGKCVEGLGQEAGLVLRWHWRASSATHLDPRPRLPPTCHFGRFLDTGRGVASVRGERRREGGDERSRAATSPRGLKRGRRKAGGAGYGKGPWGRFPWRLARVSPLGKGRGTQGIRSPELPGSESPLQPPKPLSPKGQRDPAHRPGNQG
ncbi:hypothetical protein LEMLEM_LOCUS20043 [Lemmus lemmus]